MASHTVRCILSLSAVLSCVLISNVASDDKTLDALVQQLKSKLKPKEVDEMLQQYEDKQDRIYGHTIEELAGMCKESLDKCSRRELDKVLEMGREYSKSIPQLHRFSKYCKRKLVEYCNEHYLDVTRHVSANIKEEDHKVAIHFIRKLPSISYHKPLFRGDLTASGALGSELDTGIESVYSNLVEHRKIDSKIEILSKLEEFFKIFNDVCFLRGTNIPWLLLTSSSCRLLAHESYDSTIKFRQGCCMAERFAIFAKKQQKMLKMARKLEE